ncbi:hypothetical protein DCAR_0730151 [Daucus carota subsp. sativus]|uniref:BHLH domain-containing protein n=1 Tax=Daucus carota subsp. sativus TaxID=79200 RepID=A0AAF0XQD0_DAUCS|nr:hypothetical protein DCAR_0730151 [Daucus carota subsp. sativus]
MNLTSNSKINKIRYVNVQVKGKKPKNETSSDNVDEGSISLRTEVKQDKRRGRRSADNDKKKKKKSCGAEGRRNSAPTGYVYVRARRGQATDSHSLAERVRREQIRERMELLQALVPGCDKIAGKAVMLDHVINYVQTLQNQIEFLSLRIASSDPMFNDYAYGMNSSAFVVEPAIQNEQYVEMCFFYLKLREKNLRGAKAGPGLAIAPPLITSVC